MTRSASACPLVLLWVFFINFFLSCFWHLEQCLDSLKKRFDRSSMLLLFLEYNLGYKYECTQNKKMNNVSEKVIAFLSRANNLFYLLKFPMLFYTFFKNWNFTSLLSFHFCLQSKKLSNLLKQKLSHPLV